MENTEIELEIPEYLKKVIKTLLEAKRARANREDIINYEQDLLVNINGAYYNKDITKEQAEILEKKYIAIK